jgi:GGDEF-like domain/PucR C-terminal helix-turn-helix domain
MIEDAVLQRVRSISSNADVSEDPEYVAGIRMAVQEVVDYAFVGIETGSRPTENAPNAAIAQARRAAQSGVPLDTVLRRYHAGDHLLTELIVGEAGQLPPGSLQEVLRIQGGIVDHLTETIATEYMHELERSRKSPSQRLGERVRGLLNGDRDRDPQLTYELSFWHLALIAEGHEVERLIRRLAKQANCQVLCVPAPGGAAVWAWFGFRVRPNVSDIEARLKRALASEASVAIGETHQGIEGWRLTHREAQAALQVQLYRPRQVARCREVILESAVLNDPALAASLIETYLVPLDGRSDSGSVLRRTLREYIRANQNVVTTANALDVDRKTVERRIRSVEQRVGEPLVRCLPQIWVALAVEDLLGAGRARGGDVG